MVAKTEPKIKEPVSTKSTRTAAKKIETTAAAELAKKPISTKEKRAAEKKKAVAAAAAIAKRLAAKEKANEALTAKVTLAEKKLADLYEAQRKAQVADAVEQSARRATYSLKMRDWHGLRIELSKDRGKLLQFFCAVTSYRPLPHLVAAHCGGLSLPEWDEKTERFSTPKTSKLLVGGIGAGKTGWAGAEFAMGVVANPGGWHLMAGPTNDQVVNVNLPHWERYVEEFEQAGYPLAVGKWHNTAKVQQLVCGGKVFARTYSKVGNLLGFEFSAAWLDEIETIPRSLDVWDTIDGRMRQGIAQWRQLTGTTTPNGLRNVVAKFHEARAKALGLEDKDQREHELSAWFWDRCTGFDNPYLPANYLAGLKEHYSQRRWNQEVLALILRAESIIWSEFDELRHMVHFTHFDYRAMEYDLAYDAGDQYPHVLWIARDAQGRSIVFDEICVDNIPVGKLHEEIVQRCTKLKRAPTFIVCDRAVKREIQWAQEQFPMSTVHRMNSRLEQSVSEGIELVRDRLDPVATSPMLLFAKHLKHSTERRGIITCISNYRYKQDIFGIISAIPHKDNIHDHGADALRMHQVAIYSKHSTVFSLTRKHF